jgi:hypothetical protein
MSSISSRIAIALLVICAALCGAQTQINPITQINWNQTVGSGAPSSSTCPYTATASTSSGSATISVSSVANLLANMTVTGAGIPSNTIAKSVSVATLQVTLSNNATATASGVTLSFYPLGRPYTDKTNNAAYTCTSSGWVSGGSSGGIQGIDYNGSPITPTAGIVNYTATSPIVGAPSGNAINFSCPTCSVSSGGTSVTVNGGSALGNVNINATMPSADSNFLALTPKISGANMIVEAPYATGSSPGVIEGDGSTITLSSGVASCTPATSSQSGCAKLGASGGSNVYLGYTPAHSGANSDITSLSGLTTPLSAAQGGTGGDGTGYAYGNGTSPFTYSTTIPFSAISGTVNATQLNGVSYGSSPGVNTVPVVTATNTVTYEAVPNAALVNDYVSVNGVTCILGGPNCTISASAGTITVGTTSVASGTNTYLLNDNSGTLGNVAASSLTVGNISATSNSTLTSLPSLSLPYSQLTGTPTLGTWAALNYPAWSSGTPFVKMTAAGTFSLDTSTYLTANQTITLGGILSGSGTTSITAAAASGYYMPTTTDQSNWNGKQNALTNPVTGPGGSSAVVGDFSACGNTACTAITDSGYKASSFDLSGAAATAQSNAQAYASNASNLSSGTVASGRISGSYTGITAVGTIATGVWNGTAIGTGYGGTGQAWNSSSGIPELNAGAFSLYNSSCSGSTNALTWNSSTESFGCNSISGGVATTVTIGTTTVSSGTPNYVLYDNAGTLGNTNAPSISGANFTSSSVPNAALANNTISGIALGSNLDTLTFGTHLGSGGSSYNGTANVTITSDATNSNTASTIVARDSSGNFSANLITAALSGNATTSTTATNLAGGATYGIPYQSSVGTTTFLSQVANAVLITSGSGLPSESTTLPTGMVIPYSQLSGTPTIPTSSSWPNAGTCSSGKYVDALTNGSAPTCAQVAYSQLSGTPPDAWLPEKIVPANCNNGTAGNGLSLLAGYTNPTVVCRAGTNVYTGYLQFNGALVGAAQFQDEIPGDWDTAQNPYVRVNFTQATSTSGQPIIYSIQGACSSTTDDASWETAQTFSTTTTGGTANTPYTQTLQLNSTTMSGCVAGAIMNFQINAQGDAGNGTSNLQMITITWPHKPWTAEAN